VAEEHALLVVALSVFGHASCRILGDSSVDLSCGGTLRESLG